MQSFPGSFRGLAATLSPEALITSMSAGVEQFIGYSAQELTGLPVTQILADSFAFEAPNILKSAQERGSWRGEIFYRERSGNPLKAHGALTMLSNCEGHPCGYLLFSNFDSLSASGRKEGVGESDIAANLRMIAHDLNNPLAVIMGYVQLIILDENCPGNIRTDVEKVYSELQRVIKGVEKLGSYAISLYGTAANQMPQQMSIKTSA
jgi:nitrogen-specific signal transduction histidine kinase